MASAGGGCASQSGRQPLSKYGCVLEIWKYFCHPGGVSLCCLRENTTAGSGVKAEFTRCWGWTTWVPRGNDQATTPILLLRAAYFSQCSYLPHFNWRSKKKSLYKERTWLWNMSRLLSAGGRIKTAFKCEECAVDCSVCKLSVNTTSGIQRGAGATPFNLAHTHEEEGTCFYRNFFVLQKSVQFGFSYGTWMAHRNPLSSFEEITIQ